MVDIPGGSVRLLSGENEKLNLHTNVIYQDVTLQQDNDYTLALNPAMRGFVYVLSGELSVEGVSVKQAESCFVEKHAQIEVSAVSDSRFMLCFGVPHNQPINQHGSFVD